MPSLSDVGVPWLPLAAAIMSALVGALFEAAGTSLANLPSTRLSALIEEAEGATRARFTRIQRDDRRLRARYLVGRLLGPALAAGFSIAASARMRPDLGPLAPLAVATVTAATLFAVAASIARGAPDQTALLAARYLRPLEIVLAPIALPFEWLGARFQPASGNDAARSRVTEAEVEIMVDEVERSGLVGPEPAEMIRNVLELEDRTVRDVLIPRNRVESIDMATPIDAVLAFVAESGHSRYPVYKEQVDNVAGLLYAKDLFKAIEGRDVRRTSLEALLRPANFVAESQTLSSLLREMRQRRQHLAIVVDELGTMAGIVTLEDVLEEIVGDIRDEHDDHEEGEAPARSLIEKLDDGRVVADGHVTMGDLSAYLGTNLPANGSHDSLARMLFDYAGKVPAVGTAISKFGFRFIVRDATEDAVAKVEIVRPQEADV